MLKSERLVTDWSMFRELHYHVIHLLVLLFLFIVYIKLFIIFLFRQFVWISHFYRGDDRLFFECVTNCKMLIDKKSWIEKFAFVAFGHLSSYALLFVDSIAQPRNHLSTFGARNKVFHLDLLSSFERSFLLLFLAGSFVDIVALGVYVDIANFTFEGILFHQYLYLK